MGDVVLAEPHEVPTVETTWGPRRWSEVGRQFLRLESSGGILLMGAAALSLILAQTPLHTWIAEVLHLHFHIGLGDAELDKSLLHWINDGLMSVFFLLVGLELKREFLSGELRGSRLVPPLLGAVGGVIVPIAIFVLLNAADTTARRGWAVPMATDIAFALGVLMLLGDRVHPSLKVLLVAIAIFDDLAAIIVIAVFYAGDLSVVASAGATIMVGVLIVLNRAGVRELTPYALAGLVLWVFVLESGVHATLSGVVVALAVPHRMPAGQTSPLVELEHALHPWVARLVLPAFAFANAGLGLADLSLTDLWHPFTIGISVGLVIGKPVGVFGALWLGQRLFGLTLPAGVSRRALLGLGCLTGVGFTMSLFIGTLAFTSPDWLNRVRLGVLLASIIASTLAVLVLRGAPRLDVTPPSGAHEVQSAPLAAAGESV